MGLISAALNSGSNVLSGQWKEYFYQDAIPNTVLMVAGKHKTARSSNTRGEDNIISNGSKIAVADGQCMIIVDQGKVTEVCAAPGEFIFDTSSAPSIFSSKGLWEGIKTTFAQGVENFSYGGLTASTQKVYFVNTKLIMDQPFGTTQPIYFRVVDSKVGLDSDMELRIHGHYSFQIVDPVLFYTNIATNVASEYKLSEIAGQLKADFTDALQDGLALINEDGLRPSGLPGKKQQIVDAMNQVLKSSWLETYGIELRTVKLDPPKMSPEDEATLKSLQKANAIGGNAAVAAGLALDAQNQAMVTAAGNAGGAMTGFLGMGMAGQTGTVNTNNLFAMAQQQQQQQAPAASAAPAEEPAKMGGWACRKCGAVNTGKFCAECGEPKPTEEGWTCKCGTVNKGKFCAECGSPKPEGTPTYKCDKCGWEPEDPKNPPKFCPECGDIFDDNDKV